MRALLDVNVILALLDIDHVFHSTAHKWWKKTKDFGWASCPMTENGVVRIMSQPSYAAPDQYSPADAISWLNGFASDTNYEFWPDNLSLLDENYFDTSRVLGPKQLSDIYLLGLAASKGGRLVTFDRKITSVAVRGATEENIVVID